jgi:hypothetical protein
MMALLGVFEFYSASQWVQDPTAQQVEAQALLPKSILSDGSHFIPAWLTFLITLGCVRINYGLGPENTVTWASTLVTHIVEELFWLSYASKASPGTPALELITNSVKNISTEFHTALVLVGPLLLILFIVLDYPNNTRGSAGKKGGKQA